MHQVTRHQYHQSHEPWWKFLFEDSRTCIPKPLAKHCPTCVSNNEGFLGEVNLPNCSIDKNGVEKQSEVFNDEELENKHTYNIYKYVCKNIYTYIFKNNMTFTCLERGCKTRNPLLATHTSRSSGHWWISLGLRDVCPEHSTLSAQVLLCWRMVRARGTRLARSYSQWLFLVPLIGGM